MSLMSLLKKWENDGYTIKMKNTKTMIARFQYTEQRKVAYFQKGFCWLM